MKEIEIKKMDQPETTKGAMLRRAVVISIAVFFFGIGLFIGLVILFARFASKGGPTPQ